jgi:hypothetical protein
VYVWRKNEHEKGIQGVYRDLTPQQILDVKSRLSEAAQKTLMILPPDTDDYNETRRRA